MSNAPIYSIDLDTFSNDPYPDLAMMRTTCPIAYVPQLNATLLTKRNDVFTQEKRVDVFSSRQPNGLMTTLMGENMMRKDGQEHQAERRAIFPTVSPKTVRDVWKRSFETAANTILNQMSFKATADLVTDFAMPLSAEALKTMTGLTNMHFAEMDRVSQGMIDGCANYAGDPAIEANCNDCTASIDSHIDARRRKGLDADDLSLLAVMSRAGLSDDQIRANIKLAISGGQNEPRDAIAGLAATLMSHPKEYLKICDQGATWLQAFQEYARWMSPIGMSPREVARPDTINGVSFETGDRVFLMFGSANRDESVFETPDTFDVTRDAGPAIPFGAGPHFCAGAWASKCLIADVAMPLLFQHFPNMALNSPVQYSGWAFRGPLAVHVTLD